MGISIYYSLIIYHAINVQKLAAIAVVSIELVHLVLKTLEIHQAKIYVQKIIFCRLQYSKETSTTF